MYTRKQAVPFVYYLLLAIVSSAIFNSCTPKGPIDFHTAYFDSIDVNVNFHNEHGSRHEAVRYLDSAYRKSHFQTQYTRIRKYSALSHIYLFPPEDYNLAMTYLDSAFACMHDDSLSYRNEYMRSLFAMGKIYSLQRKFDQASRYYYRGWTFAGKHMNECYAGAAAGFLSSAAFEQRQYKEAIFYMRDELSHIESCDDEREIRPMKKQGIIDNIALSYMRLGMPDSAISNFNAALNLIDQFEESTGRSLSITEARALVKGNMGSAYLAKGNIAEAERLFNETITLYGREAFNTEDGIITRLKLTNAYLKDGNLNKVKLELAAIRRSIDSFPTIDNELTWLRLAWRYNDTINNRNAAYTYYRKFNLLRDSLDVNGKLRPTDFRKSLDEIGTEHEMADLKSDYRVTKVSLTIAIWFGLMAIIIIYLIWRNYRESKNNIAALTRLNKQNQEQNAAMQKALLALQQSQQDNTRIMRIVAHDLQNPLAAMVSLSDIIGTEEDATERLEFVEMLKSSAMNAIKLTRGILQANPVLETEQLNLGELLQQCVGLLQFKANEKKQTIIFSPGNPVTVNADREKLWRVFNNLIVNAIKFSYEHSKIYVTLEKKPGRALVTVRDEGIGIPDKLKFEIFRHLTVPGREGTAGEQSHGLGLSIVKQLVEAHGGKIWFESQPDNGTTFFVELPAMD